MNLESTVLLLFAASLLSIVVAAVIMIMAVIVRVRESIERRRLARLQLAWEPIILEIMATGSAPRPLSDLIPAKHRGRFLAFAEQYASRVRGIEKTRLGEAVAPWLRPVVQALDADDPVIRARAVYTMGALGMQVEKPRILSALEDDDPMVVLAATQVLAERGLPMHARLALQALSRFADWSPDFLGATAAKTGSAMAIDLRMTVLDRSRSPRLRSVSLDALRRIKDRDAAIVADTLLIQGDEHPEVLRSALQLLGEFKHHGSAPSIRTELKHSDPEVRAAALVALGQMGDWHDLRLLHAHLSDPEPVVVLAAARGLREMFGEDELRRQLEGGLLTAPALSQVLEGVPA